MTLLSYKIFLTYHHFRIVCCSVTKSCPTLCNPYGLQHTRFPCPSPSLGIFSNLCPLCPWCHSTISSPVTPFFFCPQSFQTSESFPIALHIRWPQYWSFSISPSGEYSGLISFMIDWFYLLAIQGTFRSLLQHHI